MIAWLDRIGIAAELALYVMVAVLLSPRWTLEPVTVALMAAATFLLVRGLYIAVSLGLADRPSGQPGWQLLSAGLREWLALSATHAILQPFMARDYCGPSQPSADAAVLVLVHGYCANGAYWRPLCRRLRHYHTGPIYTPTLPRPFGSIDRQADALADELARVRREWPGRALVLVGHSMGGLTIRACRARHGLRGVATIITLGTPHSGTRRARLGWGVNARQMHPGSAWLQWLDERAPVRELPMIAIAARYDQLITPACSALPVNARKRRHVDCGHVFLGWSSVVVAELLACLASQVGGGSGPDPVNGQ